MSDQGKKFKKPLYVTEQEAEEQKRIQNALSGLNAIAYPSKKGNVMIAQSSGSAYQQVPGATPNLPAGSPPPLETGGDPYGPPRHPRLPPSNSRPTPVDPTVAGGGRVPNRGGGQNGQARSKNTSSKPKSSKPKSSKPKTKKTSLG